MASKGKSNTRIGSALSQLDNIWREFQENKGEDTNNLDQVKHIINKIQQLLIGHEKCCKDLLTKHPDAIPLLFEILQFATSNDQQITFSVCNSLCQLISTGKRMSQLLEAGLLHVITECFVQCMHYLTSAKDSLLTEDMFISFHVLLGKIGNKERRFGTIARLSGAVDCSVQVMKAYQTNTKVIQPIFQVMKIYLNSIVNCSLLIKGGVVAVLIKLLPTCGQKKMQLLRCCLELLTGICKSKTGSRKAVNQNLVPLLLSVYQDWHRTDHRNRQTLTRKLILTAIKACVLFGFGRKSFLSADGYKILYHLGMEDIECKELDGVLRLIIFILRKCTTNNKLPLKVHHSVVSFPLPSKSVEQDLTNNVVQEDSVTENSDEEDTVESDEVEVCTEDEECLECPKSLSDQSLKTDTSYQVNLGPYKKFLRELYEFENSQVTDEDNLLICIPTASSDISLDASLESDVLFDNNGLENDLSSLNFVKEIDDIGDVILLAANENSNENIMLLQTRSLSEQLKDLQINKDDTETTSRNSSNNCSQQDENGGVWMPAESCVKPNLSLNEEQTTLIDNCKVEVLSSSTLSNSYKLSNDVDEVKSILNFIKKPAPNVFGHLPTVDPEPLLDKKLYLQRLMLFQDFSRIIFPDKVISRTVYDLDSLLRADVSDTGSFENMVNTDTAIKRKNNRSPPKNSPFKRGNSANTLSRRQSKEDLLKINPLSFESRFECGNLRKVIQVRQYEYDLILNADINTNHHHQWFYFQVENMALDIQYRFNIINFEKPNSQFNFGMQPLLYSLRDATEGNPGWERTGVDVCYYKNYFTRDSSAKKTYYTATFFITFPYSNDTVYLAYHYPYSLSTLKLHLYQLQASLIPMIFYEKQVLCQSFGGNDVYVITITGVPISKYVNVSKRPHILLTARVHPGESNSSWVMKGVLDFLVSNENAARQLRSMFIFKIIPMLNPDGVVNGNHRCSLSGQDLNRQWKCPDPILHPSIFNVKALIRLMISLNKRPLVFVDFHGHSRRKNVFIYGCTNTQQKICEPLEEPLNGLNSNGSMCIDASVNNGAETDTVKIFPRILSTIAPCFSLQNCNYSMEKSKEATARIVGYKELGITRCYTMESTYCGMDQGAYKGNQISTRDLEDMGRFFCIGLLKLGLTPNIKLYDEPEIT